MAPRGLITATLVFSLPAEVAPDGFPKVAFFLVVLISSVVLKVGLQFGLQTTPGASLDRDTAPGTLDQHDRATKETADHVA